MQDKDFLTREITYWGFYVDENGIDMRLAGLKSDAAKKDALKTNLKFRRHVMCQDADKTYFQMSANGTQFSLGRLTENLKHLT